MPKIYTTQLSQKAKAFKQELENNAQENQENVSAKSAEQLRADFNVILAEWMNDQPKLPSDVIISNQEIKIDEHGVKLRLYRPSNLSQNKPNPAVLYHTAGGMVMDMQTEQDLACALMAKASNTIVISIQPPLAPEIKHPKIAEIANKTTDYLYAHANEYGIDTNAIAISGYSMGGNLACLTTLYAIEKHLPVRLMVIISGRLDVSLQTSDNPKYNSGIELDFLGTREMQQMFTDFILPEGANPKQTNFSPLFADLTQLPPTLLVGGDCDALIPDLRAMKEACDKQKVTVKLIELPGLIHNAFFLWHKLGNDGTHMATITGEEIKRYLG